MWVKMKEIRYNLLFSSTKRRDMGTMQCDTGLPPPRTGPLINYSVTQRKITSKGRVFT